MKKSIIRIIQVILVLVILYSSHKIYSYYQTNKAHDETHVEIAEISRKWEEENKTDSINIINEEEIKPTEDDLAISRISYLQNEYPNIIGWINIPGTNIDYPFVKGENNEYYLDHDYKGNYNVFGTIFMEKDNNIDFSDQNTILYGHNIRTGKFFHELTKKYRNPEFTKENSIIEISSMNGLNRYEIFAVYSADPMEKFRSPNYSEEELKLLIERINSKNEIEGEVPEVFEDILTLQTCLENDRRLVVHAKKLDN